MELIQERGKGIHSKVEADFSVTEEGKWKMTMSQAGINFQQLIQKTNANE